MRKLVVIGLVLLVITLGLYGLEKEAFRSRNQLSSDNEYLFKDAKMSYRVLGKSEGRSVILLHGSMHSAPWDGFESDLAKHFQVIIPDMPGFGASDAVEGEIHNTDLFAEALCQFVADKNLADTPMISLSLGVVVSAKAARNGCVDGKLILVGAPTKVTGVDAKLLQLIPRRLRRVLVSFRWAKDLFLIPALNSNVGDRDKKDNTLFIKDLETTDVRSIADVHYFKEINLDLPKILLAIDNEKVFVYGEQDAQKANSENLTAEYVEVKEASHNIFASKPDETLKILLEQLD